MGKSSAIAPAAWPSASVGCELPNNPACGAQSNTVRAVMLRSSAERLMLRKITIQPTELRHQSASRASGLWKREIRSRYQGPLQSPHSPPELSSSGSVTSVMVAGSTSEPPQPTRAFQLWKRDISHGSRIHFRAPTTHPSCVTEEARHQSW